MSTLFKYMSEPHDLISKGYIRATQVCALNDPFEALYSLNGLNELSKDFPSETEGHDLKPHENPYIKHTKEYFNHIGIISLSESKDNLLMWSHYANNHKGIAVGLMFVDYPNFSIFENLFNSTSIQSGLFDQTIYNGKPKPINYRKSPKYLNDKYDHDYSHIAGEGYDRVLYDIFLQKSDEWIYEKEHRIILRLEQADLVKTKDYDTIPQPAKELLDNYGVLRDRDGYKEVYLCEIPDEDYRSILAEIFAKQSTNPENIYLFKLSRKSIYSCFKGLNSHIKDRDITPNDEIRARDFEILHGRKNETFYSLDFE